MGYLIVVIVVVVVVGFLLTTALQKTSKEETGLDPEEEGTSYEKPQDEGPV
jgi:sensor histidine kinase regulating citrate/malate metabolism